MQHPHSPVDTLKNDTTAVLCSLEAIYSHCCALSPPLPLVPPEFLPQIIIFVQVKWHRTLRPTSVLVLNHLMDCGAEGHVYLYEYYISNRYALDGVG